MPTVLRVGPYRFFFFASDRNEPPHIHVRRDSADAKFWLTPVRLARQINFASHELRDIEQVIRDNEQHLLEAWHDTFSS